MATEEHFKQNQRHNQNMRDHFRRPTKEGLVRLANQLVMSWHSEGDMAEPGDPIELRMARSTIATIKRAGKRYPATARVVYELLAADQGEIITPEFKEKVLSELRLLLGL